MSDSQENDREERLKRIRERMKNADSGREPDLVSGRFGTRQISLAALRERIIEAFSAEHGSDSPHLKTASGESERRALILATTDYVLTVESIQMSPAEKAALMRRVYADLFGYGPLDALLADEDITTISLKGADHAAVRVGHGDLKVLAPQFEDEAHLRAIVNRLLADTGASLTEDEPILETGMVINGRPVCVSVAGPPITYEVSVDLRVHPRNAPVLDDLVKAGFLSDEALQLLKALVNSPHGFVIVGDTESGKTTLLSALARMLPGGGLVAVERAGELRLPDGAVSLVPQMAGPGKVAVNLGQRVREALDGAARVLLLDEVRADEAQSIGPLLADSVVPRQIWAFRGPSDSKRLASALSMIARRSATSGGEEPVHRLYERLPFVVVVRRSRGQIRLHSIAEWQYLDGSEYPSLIDLMTPDWDGSTLSGRRPMRALDLPDAFWS